MAEPSGGSDTTAERAAPELSGDEATPADAGAPRKLPRWRRILVGVLVVLVCVLAPVSLMGVWLRNTLLHTDQFVDTMGPLADDPAIQQAVANRATTALIEGTDVQLKIRQALPDRAKSLAPFITGGAEQVVHGVVLRFVESDRFENLWDQLMRRTHRQLVAVLQGKGTDTVTTNKGEVTIQLGPIVDRVLPALQQRTNLFDDVDASQVRRQVVLVDSEDLRKAQGLVDLLDKVGNYLPILVLVLFALAVWLSGNRRRTILRTALGIALATALLLTVFDLGRSAYRDALPSTVNKAAATAVYDQLLSFLRIAARTVFVLAIIVALAAWLSGPGRVATRFRAAFHREPTGEEVTPVGSFVGRYRTALRILVVAVGLILLVAINHPTPLAVLVITVLALIGLLVIELLGRRAPAATSPT
jgi:hypothetical protein